MTVAERKMPQQMLPRGLAGKFTLIMMNRMHGAIYKNMAKELGLKGDDDVLEVACGNGYFLKKYAVHVRSIAGLDLSDVSIDMARKKHRDRIEAGTAEFIQGDASQLPWEDDKFGVVTAMGSFIGFPRPLESLQEMRRVLRPGGRAVISIEWNSEDGKDHKKEVEQYGMHIWSEDEVRDMMGQTGFSDIRFSYAKAFMIPKMMTVHALK